MKEPRNIQTRPGLPEPVHSAQRIFKAALEALSRPGRPVQVFDLPPAPRDNGAMSRGMSALALALCDQDTPIWLDQACDDAETRHHLRFHCGSPLLAEPAGAAFAFIGDASRLPRLHEFSHGVPEYPDRSATLVIRAALGRPEDERFKLSGPGVRGAAEGRSQACHIGGLPGWFRKSWQENHAAYPLGLDLLFVDDGPLAEAQLHFQILGLPRGVSFEPLLRPQKFNSFNGEKLPCMSQ